MLVVRDEPDTRRMVVGLLAMLVTIATCAVAASFVKVNGPSLWSPAYAAALAGAAIGINAAVCLALDRHGSGAPQTGALLLWALLGATLSFAIPAVSYIFVWPALFALIARRSRHVVAEWVAAIVALMMLAGFAYSVAVVIMGVAGAGAIVLLSC